MPRYPRRVVPGAIVHLISRVVDREFRIDDHARAEYLRRVGPVAPRTNWRLLAYALMSNHVHWLLWCGGDSVRQLIHPIHTGFGNWLNRRDRRLTPVFAERPKTFLFAPRQTARLVAYIHNNPVRANVCADARESSWTSHRAYAGSDAPPPWLDITATMELCELAPNAAGRAALDSLVRTAAAEPRDPLYASERMTRARRDLRRRLNAPVELATPSVHDEWLEFPFVAPTTTPICERWDGDIEEMVAAAAASTGLSGADLRSRSQRREITRARRLVVLTAARHLGRSITEASAAVGLSASAGSRLLTRAPERCRELEAAATELARQLRANSS